MRFPHDEVYGEEAGTTTGTSGRRWVVDPINGTFYFAHRIPIFTVVIAVEDGPAVGVLNQPVARQMIYAGRGRGCRARTGDMEVAPVLRKVPTLAQARVEMVNPHMWRTDVLTTPHRNARACGYSGGVAGLLTGVIDAVMIAGDLTTPIAGIVERYAGRWAIEVAFADAKNTTGVGEARNRTRAAVERTVPFGLHTQSIVIIWYHLAGHHPNVVRDRRDHAPWYITKRRPSYLDVIVKLRRILIAAQYQPEVPGQATPEEISAVQLAWAQAAA